MAQKKSRLSPAKKAASSKDTARANGGSVRRSVKASAPSPDQQTVKPDSNPNSFSGNDSCPVVGIGASAGGLEAMRQLLEQLPAKTDMAFVLVQHLDPQHDSLLTELLAKSTPLPVSQVKDGMRVELNHLYVIPPNTTLNIEQGILKLIPRQDIQGQHMPIDSFFRSLAEDQGNKAMGVVLSGAASDGALGIQAIKGAGGVTFAQDEATAKYTGMPHSAIKTGCVDFILPPGKIAHELARIGRHPYVVSRAPTEVLPSEGAEDQFLGEIFNRLRSAKGVDFTAYKHSTLKRRMLRRMAVHKIESLKEYAKFLKDTPPEAEALYHDILITVTNFFRDPDSFAALTDKVFPSLLKDRSLKAPIRLWIPGCSTGEEVYSMAICLLEFLEHRASNISLQIFGTDINEAALGRARKGIYIENIVSDVSVDRLARFFVKIDGQYQVNKAIREMCVFAKQDVTMDPPFSKLDLISCRNMLIYLGPELQKRVIPIFHYALSPGGFLMLGVSETIGASTHLFTPVDKKNKIYAKKAVDGLHIDLPSRFPVADLASRTESSTKKAPEAVPDLDAHKEADRVLLTRYVPASVMINDQMDILQFRGDTSPYLVPASGKASLNLLNMARAGLLLELRQAISEARKEGIPVRKGPLQVKNSGGMKEVAITVIPLKLPPAPAHYCLVLFEEGASEAPLGSHQTSGEPRPASEEETDKDRQIIRVEQEMEATKSYLQSLVEERDNSNEELKSANEEILSSNEELQSTNEELVTAKEELQSTNEELTTMNEEITTRNNELSQMTSDLSNLFAGVNLPIVVVGPDLRIRRFTPRSEKLFNLIGTDVGRPIKNITPQINIPDLSSLVEQAVAGTLVKEQEVQDPGGIWYLLRIQPSWTAEKKSDGAVLILFDIDAIIKGRKSLAASLQEKEVLLKEIHHRVKNNLQIVSSMLNLQADLIKDPKVLEFFNQSEYRIQSMALIHEKMYQSPNLGSVDMAAYIQELAPQQLQAHTCLGSIHLQLHVDPVMLGMEAAIPCGLILNELISNACKHAFPNGRKGEIVVALRREAPDQMILQVQDDGIGIPKTLDIANAESLGLRLVHALVDQLHGTMHVDRDGTTAFTVRFPSPPPGAKTPGS